MCTAPAQAQMNGPISPIGPIPQRTTGNSPRQLPVPAARMPDSQPDYSDVHGDTHTLSSIEALGVGTFGEVQSIIDPSFNFSQLGDSAIIPGRKSSESTLGMSLAFDHQWRHSHLTGAYKGAQALYYPDSAFNTVYHNLGVANEFQFSRWLFRLRDDLMVAPDAPFGGLDAGGMAAAANYGLAGLQIADNDLDAILTQRAKRIRNLASAEANYSLSRRSVVTVAGLYNTINFSQPGYVESHGITGRIGYDYLLSAKDTLGVMYVYDRTDFTMPAVERMRTDSVQLAYGRKIAGRLAFQIAGGPQTQRSTTQGKLLTWTMTSAVNYQTRRNQYNVSYARVFSSGSGVFLGANRHNVVGTLQRALTPSWASVVSVGYARSLNLKPDPGKPDLFTNWYGTLALGRNLGRHMRADFTYGVQRQIAGNGVCLVQVACGITQTRQVGGVTLEYHPWAILPR
jgi:hypothetical protein